MPDTEQVTTADEGIAVVIEDNAAANVAAAIEPKVTEPSDELKSQFKELQTKLEGEQEARREAERRANAARDESVQARAAAVAAHNLAEDREYGNVVSGIEAAQNEAKASEQEWQSAYEKGDAAAMSAAQRKMAKAEARILRYDEAKADIEAKRGEGGKRVEQPAQVSSDPVEAYIAGRTPQTAEWLRAHREWVTDPRKNEKLTAAHYNARAEGISVDTPEYFEAVEKFIGLKNGATQQPTRTTTRRQAVPVAPVQASGGGTSGGGTEVRLTRGEAASATDGTLVWNYDDPSGNKRFKKGDNIGIQEMARRKLEMQRQGQYDKTYVEQ